MLKLHGAAFTQYSYSRVSHFIGGIICPLNFLLALHLNFLTNPRQWLMLREKLEQMQYHMDAQERAMIRHASELIFINLIVI